jgi:hypothetical protein
MVFRSIGACGALLLGLSVLGGCGGDDDGGSANGGTGGGGSGGSGAAGRAGGGAGSGSLPSSVPSSTRISDLSTAQIQALCVALDTQLTAALTEQVAARVTCTLAALIPSLTFDDNGDAVVDRAICEQEVTACLSSTMGGGVSESMCMPEELQSAAQGCTHTAGELFSCLSSSVELLVGSVDLLSCERLSDPQAAAMAFDMLGDLSDPACEALAEDCPELLES